MVFFQLDAIRFFTVYIGQGIFSAIYLFIAYKILKRNKGRLNLILSLYYIVIAIALIINFIYAPIPDLEVQRILNTLTNYIIFFGLIFLPLFSLLLKKQEKIKNLHLILIIIIYGITLFIIMFQDPQSVSIDDSSIAWRPVWELSIFFPLLIYKTTAIVIPTFILQIQLYRKFQIEELKKKWLYFNLGTGGIFIFSYGIMVANTLNDPIFRLIMAIYSISVIFWGYLTYYGVGKQIK